IALGSMTFTDIEGRPNSPEHNMDWKMNVLPHVETDGETIYWRQDKDATYSAPNSDHFKYSRLRYFTLIPGERDRFEDQVKKVAAMYKGKAYPASYNVYWRFGASTGPHVCTEINMEHWSYFDRPDTFEKDFEEVNGEGSYERFMEEYKLCIDRTKTYDELIEFQPDLSSF
ncbi:MAG TPA: hypothetical protein VJ508_19760, partial [Saprospiraceae bacterium]|nr:hypothetical protein [Saprospiraceae bacterium]